MNNQNIIRLLSSTKVYDISYHGKPSNNGWKLSILGKSLEDSLELWNRLRDYLVQNDIAHKFGTLKRIQHPNKEQSKKLLTVYIPDGFTVDEIAMQVEKKLKGYSGWHNIKTPTSYEHWGNAIFFRNDRDNLGNYIKSKNENYNMKNISTFSEFINEGKKPKGAPDFHHSDAPEAEGRFRDLGIKDLAAWLIKTREKDVKRISGSLTQQIVFNRKEDPEYAEKMEKTRKEVYKQLGREDLLESEEFSDELVKIFTSFEKDFNNEVKFAGISRTGNVITIYLDNDPNKEKNIINKLVRTKYANKLKKLQSEDDIMVFKII